MRLAIIGSGYVGLVTGACFAEAGHDVVCVDHDPERLQSLRAGRAPFFEPGLSELVVAQRSRLRFEPRLTDPVELIFIAVGASPTDPDALTSLISALPEGLIVLKSTVAVGTADQLSRVFPHRHFVSNPEFLREGSALADFRNPDRVVLGGPHADRVAPLYAGKNVLLMDSRSAELSKFAANAMLATRVSFMNELARIADVQGADIQNVKRVLASDPRIGAAFLEPGIGFGGSCLPKDVHALAAHSPLLQAVEQANVRARAALIEKAVAHFGGSLRGKRLALWGLAFKPNTDDTRQSPALAIAASLLELGAELAVFDPIARPTLDARITRASSAEAAASGADALFVLTEWPEFSRFDLSRLRSLMKSPVVFDGRNSLDSAKARAAGVTVQVIGRAL
ncbi:MAG: UDP-glucose/GDP-mannose dehydrogenase family protein [Archangium sp.]|nr:UDP-glucose/GDP-mannose dehydrogenase family protein [Archangium sp.]